MPRAARIKDPTAIYHAMSRSITEFDLFPDNTDKEYFLDLLCKCKERFNCKVYGYCLMTNHYHIIIDTCGYDISKFMKSLNQTYVKYINNKYARKGHLLAERFNSRIIDTDEYMMTVSAYVHNNAKDIPGYSGREHEYPYSSMGIYMGMRKDKRGLVCTDFVLGCIDETDRNSAVKMYVEMVAERRDEGLKNKLRDYIEEFHKTQYEYKPYRHVILRERKPEEVIRAIAERYGVDDASEVMHRWKRRTMEFRRVVAYTLTTYCGMGIREVCKCMHNITASCCAILSSKGYEVIKRNREMNTFMMNLIAS